MVSNHYQPRIKVRVGSTEPYTRLLHLSVAQKLPGQRVHVQAKRYARESAVSEPEIRAFSGSLGAAKASKGVFVTTSYFTQPARSFAERHPFRIVIDGEQLATLMIRHNVGVQVDETLYLKKVDEDFFLDE
jgi:restriction system protein